MQRRLTLALVASTLFSILFVGLGVLAIAQLTARSAAEREVAQRLNAVRDLSTGRGQRFDSVRQILGSARGDLGLDYLDLVEVEADGSVTRFDAAGRLGGGPVDGEGPAVGDGVGDDLGFNPIADLQLDDDQIETLQSQEPVLVSNRDGVIGLRVVTVERPGRGGDQEFVLAAGRRVSAVSGQVVAWFLASSAVVLVGAVGAGLWLSRRLVRPIRVIETTTAAIAGGDLAARAEVAGDDEVGDLARSVNRMAGDLQRSRALDRQFLMSVSHDLRTPLTAISGYAEALSDGAAPDPEAAGRVIGAQADRLRRLVDDLLDLARLDANRFRFNIRDFDLLVVAGRTAAGAIPQAEADGIRLVRVGPEGVVAWADPDRTAQAIGNLIDNALKFAASTVEVEVGTDGTMAAVSVSDDGPGISAEDLPHIFDRLYTGKAQPARAENPTGLGLATVRELVNAMGGEVVPSNRPEGGARITIKLPLASARVATTATKTDAGTPAGGYDRTVRMAPPHQGARPEPDVTRRHRPEPSTSPVPPPNV